MIWNFFTEPRLHNGHNVRLIVSTIGHSSPNLGTILQALKYIIGKEVSLPMDDQLVPVCSW